MSRSHWSQRRHSVWILLLLIGCADPGGAPSTGTSGYDAYDASMITFIDDIKTNTAVDQNLLDLTFVDVEGNETTPADYAHDRNVVLVVTRGNTEPICPYCSTQVSRLIANYGDFTSRGAEVLVAYPIEHGEDADRLDAFLEVTRNRLADPTQEVPFPILLDVELKAVDALGIRKNLSKPATYILDPTGKVHFAYVGANLDDRPSIKAMLSEVAKLKGAAARK